MRLRAHRRAVTGLRLGLAAVAGWVILSSVGVAAARADIWPAADSGAAAALLASMNNLRGAAGLPALAWDPMLAEEASLRSTYMAYDEQLAHTSNLADLLAAYLAVGENVGAGPTAPLVAAAFIASPEHRANILDPRFSTVGISVLDGGGLLWAAEDFGQPRVVLAPSAPAPTGSGTSTSALVETSSPAFPPLSSSSIHARIRSDAVPAASAPTDATGPEAAAASSTASDPVIPVSSQPSGPDPGALTSARTLLRAAGGPSSATTLAASMSVHRLGAPATRRIGLMGAVAAGALLVPTAAILRFRRRGAAVPLR